MLKLLGSRILLNKLEKEETTSSGIILATETRTAVKFEIMEVGDDTTLVQKGQKVLMAEFDPDEVFLDGEKLYVADELDVIAICA